MPFACIHIPHFILQAALRAEPELRAQPAGIVEGTPPLLTIVALNEKAALLGLRLEMTKLQAEQIPGLQLRQRSAAHETAAHAALLDLALAFSPRIEDTTADTIALDLAGLAALFGSLKIWGSSWWRGRRIWIQRKCWRGFDILRRRSLRRVAFPA